MGARQSKRSVDITTTPKKEGGANSGDSAVIGDAAAPGDGKLERIEESDAKPTTNGIALHTDLAEDKDKDKDEATEKDKDLQQSEEAKSEDATKQQESSGDSPAEGAEVTTPTEANPASPNAATAVTSPDSKEPKKKDKMRKKWSLRSISFSKKDKSKPTREETPKNGDVAKEEPLAEGGEEGENAASSPAEEKSTASSPSENESSAPLSPSVVESKEESVPSAAVAATTDASKETATATTTITAAEATTTPPPPSSATTTTTTAAETETATTTAATTTTTTTATPPPPPPPTSSSPVAEEKKEELAPTAPVSAPLEDKTEEPEKVETEKNVVEVSPAADGRTVVANTVEVSVFKVEPLETSSIIERKTSEDLLAHLPSSPPPTPIEPSPLQQQQDRQAATAAAAATVLAKVLNLPPDPVVDAPLPVLDPCQIDPPPSPPPPPRELSASPLGEGPSPERNALHATPDSSSSSSSVAVPSAAVTARSEPVSETERVPPLETTRSSSEKSNPSETTKSDQDIRQTETILESSERSEEPEDPEESIEESEANADVVIKVEEVPTDDAAVADELVQDFEEVVVEPSEDVNEEEERVTVSNNDEDDTRKEDDGEVTVPVFVADADDMEQEVLVEAKPAVVIPSEEEEEEEVKEDVEIVEEVVAEVVDEVVDEETEIDDDSKEVIESVEVILPEDQIESKSISETAATPIEETVPLEVFEVEVESPSGDSAVESIEQPISETIAIVEKLVDGEKDIIEIAEIETSPVPPSPILETMTVETDVSSAGDSPSLPRSSPPNVAQIASTNERKPSPATVVIDPSDTVIPEEIITSTACPLRVASSEFPSPTEELSSSLPRSNDNENLSLPTESTTETTTTTTTVLLTSSTTDSHQVPLRSSTSNATDVTTAMSDRSQILSYDDSSDRKFKTESMSPSLDSYDHSESESKERLAHSPAETENGEEISSRRSFNDDASTAIQENHQSSEKSPESEAPVEKSVPRESVKTSMEIVEEVAPKVVAPAPPTVPIEIPAMPPPSVPAITEDVASVTKAIEEIDISDKAVAAAVNEAIECNTNEIIADAHHQNNMNE